VDSGSLGFKKGAGTMIVRHSFLSPLPSPVRHCWTQSGRRL